mmetsp:Transcript_1248/g.4643  ORF Transcript_1248/g.4643 Transcript_1248/m.4643 type:complete len:417 (+) Transcript_1248:395-1645(+)
MTSDGSGSNAVILCAYLRPHSRILACIGSFGLVEHRTFFRAAAMSSPVMIGSSLSAAGTSASAAAAFFSISFSAASAFAPSVVSTATADSPLSPAVSSSFTCFVCSCALITLPVALRAASRHRLCRSDPLKCCSSSASFCRSTSGVSLYCSSVLVKICLRALGLGRSTKRRHERRRTIAWSMPCGRLVAASTTTRSWPLFIPSHCCMRTTICCSIMSLLELPDSPPLSRAGKMASHSSKKMRHGSRLRARVKTALAMFSEVPTLAFGLRTALSTYRKDMPPSLASALASIVLPVPGGPNKRAPLGCEASPPCGKSAAYSGIVGTITCDLTSSTTASRPPICSNLTVSFSAETSASFSTFSSHLSSFCFFFAAFFAFSAVGSAGTKILRSCSISALISSQPSARSLRAFSAFETMGS